MSEMAQCIVQAATAVGIATLAAALVGIPLGVFVALTRAFPKRSASPLWRLWGNLVELWRSLPFLLVLLLCPPAAAGLPMLPLVLIAIPLAARLTEAALRQVDVHAVDTARAMGASSWDVVRYVLLPEARRDVPRGLCITITALIGCAVITAMLGSGGISQWAPQHGSTHLRGDGLMAVGLALVIAVHCVQVNGERLLRSRGAPRPARA